MKTGSIDYYGFDIFFDSKIFLRKNLKYCVQVIIDGPDSCFGMDGVDRCKVQSDGGVTFSFLDCNEKYRYRTDIDEGQFAAFLYRLVE